MSASRIFRSENIGVRHVVREDVLLQDRFPELFAAYRRHFVEGFEHKFFNQRSGHIRVLEEEPWRGRWQRAKAQGKDLAFPAGSRAGDRILEKHLSMDSWNRHAMSGRTAARPLGDYYWFGLYAGKTTRHVVFDIDNHGGGTWYRDEQGKRLPLADLPIRFLADVARLYKLRHPPDVLMTSSANLGLYAYVQFERPHVTSRVLDHFAGEAAEAGLACELYPNTSNCLRRPMGQGSVTLSSRGILRHFADQMDHYLEPSPLPPFEDVVEMFVDLWADQHAHLASCYSEDESRPWEPRIDVPGKIARMNEQIGRIRDWMAEGCPDELDEVAAKTNSNPRATNPLKPVAGTGQCWPDECRAPWMRWLDRVHRLASEGLWLPDTLNPALLDLATWLLAVELHDTEDRGERGERLLEVFCATRHNGMSNRLAGVESVKDLPKEVRSTIAEAIETAKASVAKFAQAREGQYRKPLKVAYLLTGEGEPNGYAPGAAGDLGYKTREQNHPFIKGTLGVVPPKLEVLLSTGALDRSLAPELEAIIEGVARRGNAPMFLRRLVNYLMLCGGQARVHQDKLLLLAGTDHLRQLRRFKQAGIKAGLFVASDDAIRMVRSNRYSLIIRSGGT